MTFANLLREIRRGLHFIAIVVFTVIICRNLFLPGLPSGTDLLIWITWLTLSSRHNWWFSTWFPMRSFGEPSLLYSLQMNPLLLILSFLLKPISAIKFYIFLMIFVSGISMYYLIKNYQKNRIACLLGTFIYMTHQLFISQLTEGHIALIFGYSFFPALLLIYDKILVNDGKTTKKYNLIFFSLLVFLYVTCSQPYFIFITFIFLLLYTFINITWFYYKHEMSQILFIIKRTAISGLISIGVSSFIIVPYIFGVKQILFPPGRIYLTKLVESTNFFDAIMGRSSEISFLYFSHNLDFHFSSLGYYAGIIIPILAYIAIFFKKDRHVVAFTLLAFISAFLSKGDNPPFGQIYVWLYNNVPYFSNIWASSRWNIIEALSYAFLGAYSFSQISIHLETISIFQLRKLVGRTVTSLFKALIVVLVVLSSIAFSYNGFNYGLKTFEFPREYLAPYYNLQTTDHYSFILPLPFRYGYSITPEGGLSRSPLFYSPAIHDKWIIDGEGGTMYTRYFLDFVYNTIKSGNTNSLLEILGALNTRYVTIQPYPERDFLVYPEDELTFFLNQKGVNITSIDSYNNVILENSYWKEIIHPVSNIGVTYGGLRSLMGLSTIEGINISNWSMIVSDKNLQEEVYKTTNFVAFYDTEFLDFVMSLNQPELIEASDFSSKETHDPKKAWIKSPFWKQIGFFTLSDHTLGTSGNNRVAIHFRCQTEGDYFILMRVAFAQDRGKLSASIGNYLLFDNFRPHASYERRSLQWVKFGPIYLEKGSHTLYIANDGSGPNDIDVIAIIEPSFLEKKIEEAKELIQDFQARIIYLFEAERLFKFSNSENWRIIHIPYKYSEYGLAYGDIYDFSNSWKMVHKLDFYDLSRSRGMIDDIIYNVGKGGETLGFGFEDWSNYIISAKVKVLSGDDVAIDFRWNGENDCYRMQQIGDDGKYFLVLVKGSRVGDKGLVKITLENYDPSEWHEWKIVANENNMKLFLDDELKLNYTDLKYPYLNGKLRLRTYDSSVRFHVEISLEEWQDESLHSQIFIPKTGQYLLGVRGITYFGNLTISMDDKDIFNAVPTYHQEPKWCSLGTLTLSEGWHSISLNTNGIFNLDQIALFSIKEGEKVASIEEMFNPSSNAITEYTVNSPYEYVVHVNTSEPVFLVFAQSYHPLWRAYFDKREILSVNTYGCVNGFYLNKTGTYDVTIKFIGQRYLFIGGVISISIFISLTASFLFPDERIKSYWKNMLQKLK